MQDNYQIIIADDHEILLDGITSILKSFNEYEIRGIFKNGEDALEFVKNNQVDLAILDIRMPGIDGIMTAKMIKEISPGTKTLLLSMNDQQGYVKKAIEADVDGYMLKDFGKHELQNAVNAVLQGHRFFSPSVTGHLVDQIQNISTNPLIRLSSRELQILQLLSDGNTSEEIGETICVSKHTVNTYRKNLIEKFEVKNVSELIKVAVLEGYILN